MILRYKFGDLIVSGVSPLLMSVIWMQPLAWEDLQLLIARTGSASEGRVCASFVLLLIISPDHPHLVTAGGRILVKLDFCSQQFSFSCVFLRDV